MLIIIPVRIGTEKLSFQGNGRASSTAADTAPMIRKKIGKPSGRKLNPIALNPAVTRKLNEPSKVLLAEIRTLFMFCPTKAANVSPTITKVQAAITTDLLNNSEVTRQPSSK